MEPKPKRKYTVSAKVLAANQRNLQKANAIPKEIRYRSTPRRQTACRENLRKALAARQPASPPQRRPWNGRSLLGGLRRWGQNALDHLQGHRVAVAGSLQPKNEIETKLAQGLADGFTRWLSLLRDRVEREQDVLLRLWAAAPRDARSATRLGCRLVGMFRDEAWMEEALERLELRLRRVGRMFWETRNTPSHGLRQALEETSVEELSNPFRPVKSMRMQLVLAKPAKELQVTMGTGQIVVPGLAGEQRLPDRSAEVAPPLDRNAGVSPASDHNADVSPPPDRNAGVSPALDSHARVWPALKADSWPNHFNDYHQLVAQSLSAPEELVPLVERIARLSWERRQAAALEQTRLAIGLTRTLGDCFTHMSALDLVDLVLDQLAGEEWREGQAKAKKVEEELVEAFGEYLERRFPVAAVPFAAPGEGSDTGEAPENPPTPPATESSLQTDSAPSDFVTQGSAASGSIFSPAASNPSDSHPSATDPSAPAPPAPGTGGAPPAAPETESG
jgi:hypothetical protein